MPGRSGQKKGSILVLGFYTALIIHRLCFVMSDVARCTRMMMGRAVGRNLELTSLHKDVIRHEVDNEENHKTSKL